MIHLWLFLICAAGFFLLCLAKPRHQQALAGAKLATEWEGRLRAGGAVLLAAAFALAGLKLGWAYGSVEWVGQLSLGAIANVVLLNRRTGRKG